MKKLISTIVLMACISVSHAAEQLLKPFVLAEVTTGDVVTVQKQVERKLTEGGFEIAGAYSPYKTAAVIVVTNDEMKQNAARSEFGGYGAAQRVAITKVGEDIQISFTNPVYMSHAYRMKGDLRNIRRKLEKVLGYKSDFGAKGITPSKLRQYFYMFGMERFDDLTMHLLAWYPEDQDKAIKVVEANLAMGVAGVRKVYRIDIPGKDESVFGVSMKKTAIDEDKHMDDGYIMGVIDFKSPRSTAHLPYEIVVSGGKVYHLYARFRIAISFPDLPMMGDKSFMRLIQSPEAIKKALTKVAGGKVESNYWEQ